MGIAILKMIGFHCWRMRGGQEQVKGAENTWRENLLTFSFLYFRSSLCSSISGHFQKNHPPSAFCDIPHQSAQGIVGDQRLLNLCDGWPVRVWHVPGSTERFAKPKNASNLAFLHPSSYSHSRCCWSFSLEKGSQGGLLQFSCHGMCSVFMSRFLTRKWKRMMRWRSEASKVWTLSAKKSRRR